MSGPLPIVVGIGEILWDQLPWGRQLGGAPANFAYCSHLLGNQAMIASRVGDDTLGREIRERLRQLGMTDQFVELDRSHSTGTVQVNLGARGQPTFVISYPAAWDFLEITDPWQDLARSADALCFGSLAQRSATSRRTISSMLERTRPQALRVFDVNLRQEYFSADVIRSSFASATLVKVSHEELPTVSRLLEFSDATPSRFCQQALDNFSLELVAITRGENGSLLVNRRGFSEHPGFRVRVTDAVGAGDAFTAGLVHAYLRRGSLDDISERANRLGAWVASSPGAMPRAPESGLEPALAELKRK
ncbi:MAG: carbohydrate kinase [Acidobacteria bacterium]|nr:carbohydrate kinase [Acidobacteriota bacterium]